MSALHEEDGSADHDDIPPPEPADADHWQTMAVHGDVRGLLNVMEDAKPGISNIEAIGGALGLAIEVLARSDPRAFAEFLKDEMLGTAGKLMVRARLALAQQLHQNYDSIHQGRDRATPSQFDEVADRVMALDAYVLKLLHANASMQKVQEQVRKLRIANDKAEAKKARPRPSTRRRRLSTPRQSMATNSRIGEGLP